MPPHSINLSIGCEAPAISAMGRRSSKFKLRDRRGLIGSPLRRPHALCVAGMSVTRELRRRMRGLRALPGRSKGYPHPHWLALAFHSVARMLNCGVHGAVTKAQGASRVLMTIGARQSLRRTCRLGADENGALAARAAEPSARSSTGCGGGAEGFAAGAPSWLYYINR